MFADTRTEWRVADIERQLTSLERKSYEVDSLRSDVARLERSNGELGTEIVGLRAQLETALDAIRQLQQAEIDRLQSAHPANHDLA